MSTRHRSTRRTVLRTIGALGAATTAASATASATDTETASSSSDARSRSSVGCGSTGDPDGDASRYVATVDRIVDGRHVVLLLEDDGELVDQHVAPRSRLEAVEEGDRLLVVLEDDALRVALPLPRRSDRRPTDPTPQERFDSLVTDDDP